MSVHSIRAASQASSSGTLVERMARLRADANIVAAEHTDAFLQALADAAALAEQIAGGGEAYSVGVREVARRTHGELTAKVLSLRAIQQRIH
jgi:predicted regulator of Ras-like GTPase activity (Roadblock/LC7/MglB family)